MKKIKAKFRVDEVTNYGQGRGKVSLSAVTGNGESEENQTFWQYTPAGQLTMTIDNEQALSAFVPGAEYYLDFTKAED